MTAPAADDDDLCARLRDFAASNVLDWIDSDVALIREAAAALEASEQMADYWHGGFTGQKARADAAEARCAELERDAARLDYLERTIYDGSYASIFNDIIAVCQHSYSVIGPGPALRSTIDVQMLAAIDAAREKK